MKTPCSGGLGTQLLRTLLLVMSVAGFAVFFVPVFGGILNVANLGAMGFFLLLGAVSLWWQGFVRLVSRLRANSWGRLLLVLFGGGLAILLGGLLVLYGLIASKLWEKPKDPCETVIVLGCQVRGETPSLMLRYRIEAAEQYLLEHPDAVAILSGGQGAGERISEAECMARALRKKGIDSARLYREEASSVTLENLRFSMELMEREGLSSPVVLVSNDFHIYRALKMAEDLGLPAQGLAAKSQWWYSRPTFILREALAMIKYKLVNASITAQSQN